MSQYTTSQLFRALLAVKAPRDLPKEVIAVQEARQMRGGGAHLTLVVGRRAPFVNEEILLTLTREEFLAWRCECQLIAQLDAAAPAGPRV